MKSGLEGRNNLTERQYNGIRDGSLNEVRPRRPEQCMVGRGTASTGIYGLNEVRPRRPEQSVEDDDE